MEKKVRMVYIMVAAIRQNPFRAPGDRPRSDFGPERTSEKHRRAAAPTTASTVALLVMTAVWIALAAVCVTRYLHHAGRDFPLMAILAILLAGFHIALIPRRLRSHRADPKTPRR
jgi:hypothetical protein